MTGGIIVASDSQGSGGEGCTTDKPGLECHMKNEGPEHSWFKIHGGLCTDYGSYCSLNICSLPAWDPMGVMTMALRALKFYGTDPQVAPQPPASPQGLPLQFLAGGHQSEGQQPLEPGDSAHLPSRAWPRASNSTFEGDWRRLGTVRGPGRGHQASKTSAVLSLQMGSPPKLCVGHLFGSWQPLLMQTTSTLWLGFQASEAYLIKQSSGYREATLDGSKEKSLSSSLNLAECSTPPSSGGTAGAARPARVDLEGPGQGVRVCLWGRGRQWHH